MFAWMSGLCCWFQVANNLCTPKSGEILVASTQDFLTSSYLITRKDTFYDRAAFTLMCTYMGDAAETVDLPTPAILKVDEISAAYNIVPVLSFAHYCSLHKGWRNCKCRWGSFLSCPNDGLVIWSYWQPLELWTGKQIFSVLVRPNVNTRVFVNLVVTEKNYNKKANIGSMCITDGYVCFRNSELICGQLGKATLGVSSAYQTCAISVRRYYKLKISYAAFWPGSIFWVQIMSLV